MQQALDALRREVDDLALVLGHTRLDKLEVAVESMSDIDAVAHSLPAALADSGGLDIASRFDLAHLEVVLDGGINAAIYSGVKRLLEAAR